MDKYEKLTEKVKAGSDPIDAIMEIEADRYTRDIMDMLEGKKNIRPESAEQINLHEIENDYLKKIVHDFLGYL